MKIHLHRLDAKARARHLSVDSQRNSLVRLNPNHEHIQVMRVFVKEHGRRFFKMNRYVRC